MAFDPYQEKGMPLDQQVRSWTKLDVKPYDKNVVHPYTRCRVILMNGIETEAAIFKHAFSRMCPDTDLKKQVAFIRRIEQQQQKMINWLIPPDESVIENTIGYEQLAVDLTAVLAGLVSNSYVKKVFDFGLLEDFDHLYRYANLLDLVEGKDAGDIVQGQTEITLGRPTIAEHRHPFDSFRKFSDMSASPPLDTLCILTLLSRGAADNELLHECRQQGSGRHREGTLPGDRDGRGAARVAVRKPQRPPRIVARNAGAPRV